MRGRNSARVIHRCTQKCHVATWSAGQFTLICNRSCGRSSDKVVVTCHEIGIGDVKCRCDNSSRINPRTGSKHDAIRIDDINLAISAELTEYLRRLGREYTVENTCGRVRLNKVDTCLSTNIEAIPVDDSLLTQLINIQLVGGCLANAGSTSSNNTSLWKGQWRGRRE